VIQGGICGRPAIFLSNGTTFSKGFSGGYIDINITFLDQSWSSAWLALFQLAAINTLFITFELSL
jgi:hypothetical protein